MVLFVYGFPNRIAALQFEHAWQHSYQTRHIDKVYRITNNRNSGKSYAHKIGNIRLLLKSEFFNRMNLKIQFFNNEAYKIFIDNKFKVLFKLNYSNLTYNDVKSGDHELNLDKIKEFKSNILKNDESLIEKFENVLINKNLNCSLCANKIDYLNDKFDLISICYHDGCESLNHLSCLRNKFHEDENIEISFSQKKAFEVPSSDLIPNRGVCPSCDKNLVWSEIVNHSTRIRYILGYDGKQPELEDEELHDGSD